MRNIEKNSNNQDVQKLRKRFCSDTNIPIKIFTQPYFDSRLDLFEKMYGARTKFEAFMEEVSKFGSEQEYFEYYNKVKDTAMNSITDSEEYKEFNSCELDKFAVNTHNIKRKDIFHGENDKKMFISIDIAKGNFTALKWYNKGIVANCNTYEEFIGKFAGDFKHIIESKYIRQVIFGHCNPSRQTTVEKYIMGQLLENLLLKHFDIADIECFTDDEIVVRVSKNLTIKNYMQFTKELNEYADREGITLHCDGFTLHKIEDTPFFYKRYITGENKWGSKELKCVDGMSLPFVIRAINKEEVTEEDKVFVYENRLAKFIEPPIIKL